VLSPVKRIEILTGVQELPLVEQALKRQGITGYMILRDVQGKGDRRLESVDLLTGESQSRLIMTTCPPADIDDLVEALRPILSRYGGDCVVYDAACVIHVHHYDPMTGGVVHSEH
jgi:nitrogen regulatory protein PII